MQEQEGPLLHRAPFLRSAQWQVMARSVPKLPSLGKESQETNVFEITHNRASCAGAHLEAAAQRFFVDTAKGIHEQYDEGFVDGVAVGAEGDTPADALEGLRARDLCQSLPQFIRRDTLFISSPGVQGQFTPGQQLQGGIVRKHDIIIGTSIAICSRWLLAVRVGGIGVVGEEGRFLRLEARDLPFIWVGKGGKVQAAEVGSAAGRISAQFVEGVSAQDLYVGS